MSELKMAMPKLPDIQLDETMIVEEGGEFYEEPQEEGAVYTEEAIASAIGYFSAFGLPQPWLSKKALEYKQAAIDVGLARNVALLIEKYFPQLQDKPEYAVLLSIIAFAAIVIPDRLALQQKLKAVQKKYVPPKKGENKEVNENAGPQNSENVEQ